MCESDNCVQSGERNNDANRGGYKFALTYAWDIFPSHRSFIKSPLSTIFPEYENCSKYDNVLKYDNSTEYDKYLQEDCRIEVRKIVGLTVKYLKYPLFTMLSHHVNRQRVNHIGVLKNI